MNNWEDLYKNQRDNLELYRALIRYSKHFNAPFPMFMIGEATVDNIDQCIQKKSRIRSSTRLNLLGTASTGTEFRK